MRLASGVKTNVCDQTFRRALHEKGYNFLHSRKKGLLTEKDIFRRVTFARNMKRNYGVDFWTEELSFYFDGVGFHHKYNPLDDAKSTKTMAWRKRDEGLEPGCTAKGTHVGSGGRVAHFFVAIAYGKGTILCEQYDGRVNGQMFAEFVEKHFLNTFEKSTNPLGKLFLQDGDPSQNSRTAKLSLEAIGANVFPIPPRSPDINPIENIFNYVKEELHKQALEEQIMQEDFDTFSRRVKNTLENMSPTYIDKTIASMDKRMSMIVESKGKRIKY